MSNYTVAMHLRCMVVVHDAAGEHEAIGRAQEELGLAPVSLIAADVHRIETREELARAEDDADAISEGSGNG